MGVLATLYIECFTKFYLPTKFESRDMDPSLHILKCALQVIKAFKHDNIAQPKKS